MSKPNLFKRLFSSVSSLPQTLRDAMSNNALRQKLWDALKEIEPGLYYVEDEDPDTKVVVYSTRVVYNEWEYKCEMFWWSRTYTLSESGEVTVNDDRQQVEPTMIYKPVGEDVGMEATLTTAEGECGCKGKAISTGQPAQGDDMSMKDSERSELIGRLIASTANPFDEASRKALEGFSDETLTAMMKQCEEMTKEEKEKMKEEMKDSDKKVSTSAAAPGQKVLTDAEYADLKAAADAHKAQQQARKDHLITALSTAQQAFTEADLKVMELPFLEKLALSHKVDEPLTADYSIRGVSAPKVSGENKDHTPPKHWDLALAKRKEQQTVKVN